MREASSARASRKQWRRIAIVPFWVSALLLLSCTSPTSSTVTPAQQPAPSTPKTLQLGILQKEPNSGIALFALTTTGAREPALAFHAGLTVYDDHGTLQPRLAVRLPSISGGDWKTNPDGSMDVTWKLKPSLTWHDGAPLTADDFVFGMQVYQDKDLPVAPRSEVKLIGGVTAPDAQTLVVHWKDTYADANVGDIYELPAVPRHILGDLYTAGDKQAFINSAYWARQFVGAGPYRLGEWVAGSYVEGLAFDGYVDGRPKVDRILFRYYGDVNTLVANLLTKQVDVVPVGSLELENAIAIKQQWGTTGGSVLSIPNHFHHAELNMREPSAPWVHDVRVRAAMAQMLDRQSYVDALMYGLSTIADIPLSPDDPDFAAAKRLGYPTYPFDVKQAQQLLADAGWTKGADGVEQRNGERFTVQFVSTGAADSIDGRETLIVTDQWRAGGLDATADVLSQDDADLDQKRATVHGGGTRGPAVTPVGMFTSFITDQIAADQNRWRGLNRYGYSNPNLDQLYLKWSVTLDPTERQNQDAQAVQLLAKDVAYLPLYYSPDVAAYRTGVQGPGSAPAIQAINAWNISSWTID